MIKIMDYFKILPRDILLMVDEINDYWLRHVKMILNQIFTDEEIKKNIRMRKDEVISWLEHHGVWTELVDIYGGDYLLVTDLALLSNDQLFNIIFYLVKKFNLLTIRVNLILMGNKSEYRIGEKDGKLVMEKWLISK